MTVWSLANQKGGVGKTTLAAALAGAAVARGKTVCVVDLDPQSSLTSYFGIELSGRDTASYALFMTDDLAPETLAVPTATRDLFVIPGDPALSTLDREATRRPGMGRAMGRAASKLQSSFDYVIFDCPPMHGLLLVNAIVAADCVVMPVQTEYLALVGLARMLRTVGMIEQSTKLPIARLIVANMFDKRTRAGIQTLRQLREEHDGELWSGVIPVDTRFREAGRSQLPISQAFPAARGAVAVEALYDRLTRGENPPAERNLLGQGDSGRQRQSSPCP